MSGEVCIHGHFYQPSRGNPWTGIVEREPTAAPWHDWNDRICDQSYRPNTAARILGDRGLIRTAISTYSRISFDLGPTLFSWLERERPGVYEAILQSDLQAQRRFNGHGTAIAHPYHHSILPLLPLRDRVTEVRWGIRDFEDRFGRSPEGMWLPEMAVDRETLEVLADHGIRFTILAPHQADRIRDLRGGEWVSAAGDPAALRHPCTCRFPSGKEIAVFFHDAGISREVAFGNLLENGDRFADRLLAAAAPEGLLHVATDGETFGHHRTFGEMALARCISRLDAPPPRLTVYGEYLDAHPPLLEVEISERTSWSCPHGLSRWDGGCECASGRHPGWNHAWRGPFRQAMARLADRLRDEYLREAGTIFTDPWAARDDSLSLAREPSPRRARDFVTTHARRDPTGESFRRALGLLELARQSLAMQTSCALFFDDIGDREPVQALRHAARAIQLCRDLCGTDTLPWFLDLLSGIRGNRPHLPDGGAVYRTCVLPLVLSPDQQAACLALEDIRRGRSSLTLTRPGTTEFIACGTVRDGHDLSLSGHPLHYCFLAAGTDTALIGCSGDGGLPPEACRGIFRMFRMQGYAAGREALLQAGIFPLLSPEDLPPAGRRAIALLQIQRMQEAWDRTAGIILDHHTGLVGSGPDRNGPGPEVTRLAGSAFTYRLRTLLASPASTVRDLGELAGECSRGNVHPDARELRDAAGEFLGRLGDDWAAHPGAGERLDNVVEALAILRGLSVPVDLWSLQNRFLAVRDGPVWQVRRGSAMDDPGIAAWVNRFRLLGRELGVECD